MPRRFPLVLAALAAFGAVALAACSGAPAAPPLTDPKEILTKAVEAAQKGTSVHFKADVSGSIPFDPTGQGTGGPLELSGTTAEGDLDIAGGNAKLSFSAPTFLGLSGEAIVVGKDTYLKASLFGPKYQKSTTGADSPAGPMSDPQQALADLKKALDKLPAPPTKLPDDKCGDRDCYVVSVPISSTDLGGAIGSVAPGVEGSGTVDVWVRKDDLRPAKVSLAADGGAQGKLTVTIELTKWDESVSIDAPSADQVVTGSPAP